MTLEKELRKQCQNCSRELTRFQKLYCNRECVRDYKLKTHKRTCKVCDKTPLEVEFGKQKNTIDGLRTICRSCDRTRSNNSIRNYSPDRKRIRLERSRSDQYKNTALKRNFGISMDHYYELMSKQSNCCAICKYLFDSKILPNVDHNHETGVVRGLLCRMCNLGLGMFKDDSSKLSKAVLYLEESSKKAHVSRVQKLLAKRKNEVPCDLKSTRNILVISHEGRFRLIEHQNFRCALCLDDISHLNFRQINIDHNHKDMFIRGALCKHCNVGLGMFAENPFHLLEAIKYLSEK